MARVVATDAGVGGETAAPTSGSGGTPAANNADDAGGAGAAPPSDKDPSAKPLAKTPSKPSVAWGKVRTSHKMMQAWTRDDAPLTLHVHIGGALNVVPNHRDHDQSGWGSPCARGARGARTTRRLQLSSTPPDSFARSWVDALPPRCLSCLSNERTNERTDK